MAHKKNYVLDTSVYLTEATSIYKFGRNDLFVPLKVLEEIDNHKKSKDYWSGRTDGNTWTVVKKKEENIKEIIAVKINDARGVTLFGESLTKEELLYETN